MIKRVNPTGRRRIPHQHVQIEVLDGDPRSFTATIDLAGFAAPEDAGVVMEATCAGSSQVLRFEWGTVARPTPPPDRLLQGLAGQHVLFTLKIVDRNDPFRRLLGVAEHIRPIRGGKRTAIGRQGILPVELAEDLGEEPWRLEYRPADVFLLINARLPFLRDQLRRDPLVSSLIYPQVVRQVLQQALAVPAEEDARDSWQSRWLGFGSQLHPERVTAPTDEDQGELDEWINAVVNQFCRQHELLQRLIRRAGEAGWEELS
ncbi:MAG: hypothetical protein ACKO2P_07650 [Planctomycetota bacterium]